MENLLIHQEIKNGILRYEYQYYLKEEQRVYHGFYKSYYPNNTLAEVKNYKDNKLEGLYQGYYANRNLKEEVNCTDNQYNGLYKKYYETGEKLCEINYLNGFQNGLTQYFYKNNQLQSSVNHIINANEFGEIVSVYNGEKLEYYEDGTIKSKAMFSLGVLNGDYIQYDNNGKIIIHYIYKDGEVEQVIA